MTERPMVSICTKAPPFVVTITDYPGRPPLGDGPKREFWERWVADLQQEVKHYQEQFAQFAKEINEDEEEIDRLTKENDKLRIELEGKKQSAHHDFNLYSRSCDSLTMECDNLRLELENLKKTYSDFRKEHDMLSDRNRNKDKVIEELRELLQEEKASNAQLLHSLDGKKRLLNSISKASTQEAEKAQEPLDNPPPHPLP